MKPKDKVKPGSPGWLLKLCRIHRGSVWAKGKRVGTGNVALCVLVWGLNLGLEVVAGTAFFYCVQRQYGSQ